MSERALQDAALSGKPVKAVVWDLDGTLWDGVLLEDPDVRLREGIADVIARLDGRGILHSIASRNDPDAALRKLRDFGLAEYFLAPQIGWEAKSESVRRIAKDLNIAEDTLLFVDDQAFERAEVASGAKDVRVVDAALALSLPDEPLLTPATVTEEARRRRLSYQQDTARATSEREFKGPSDAFLQTLDLQLTVAAAEDGDLHRAEELVMRTNQLNSTGVTYSYAELDRLRTSPRHRLAIASLCDRFGDYGKVAVVLLDVAPECWRLRLLLVSCRVMSRGVGAVLLTHVMRQARAAGARFEADFRDTGRNRAMQITYRFAGFREQRREGDIVVMSHDLASLPELPDHIVLHDEQPHSRPSLA